MSSLKIDCEELPEKILRLKLSGYLDTHNYAKLETLFEQKLQQGFNRFVVELSQLEYISSAGAGVFIGAATTAQESQGDIVLVRPSPEVQEIFELLGVLQIFRVVKDEREAIAQF